MILEAPKVNPIVFHDVTFAVCGRAEAIRELRSPKRAWTHVISIVDADKEDVPSMRVRSLRLRFDDVNPNNTSPEDVKARFGYVAATRADIEKIVDFAVAMPADSKLLVHCEMGISRSAAAAVIALMARYGVDYPEAAAAVKKARPSAQPNSWMVWLYGNILTEKAPKIIEFADLLKKR